MTLIIGLSGRKQSGKGTLCRFLSDNARVLFPHCEQTPVASYAKIYSMAGALKRFCHEVLGLTREQCYGSDADKNTPTRYRWEDLPHYHRLHHEAEEEAYEWASKQPWVNHFQFYENIEERMKKRLPKGAMTARQVLQEVGTGIFRRMWSDVWNQACLAEIRRDGLPVALIDDLRFPDEVAAVEAAGGTVVRLSRGPFAGVDEHESERALDGHLFRYRLDNARLGVEESCRELLMVLADAGLIEERVARSTIPAVPLGVAA